MSASFSPHRAIGLYNRIGKSLAYHMRQRNPDGAREVLKEIRFQDDAGGEEELSRIIRSICIGAATVQGVRIHPKDRERWSQWAMALWV